MKTDSLFYRLFQQFPNIFFEASAARSGGWPSRGALIELIETIIVYKFTNLSREEIEMMLGLGELKQTRVYQEGREEGVIESIVEVLSARFGVVPPEVAQRLAEVEQVMVLKELLRQAVAVGSLQEFEQSLS